MSDKIRIISTVVFKQQLGVNKLDVVKNPNTGKWFAADDAGNYYKVHQQTDWATKPEISILVPNDDLSAACLVPTSILPNEAVATY